VKEVICEEAARLSLQVYHDRLCAVVLTGSLARNEGTFLEDELGCRVLGDAEFLLVCAERTELPSVPDLLVIQEKIAQRLRRRGIRVEVTLNAVRPDYLRRLPPSIFAYELRTCGNVIAGDPQVLRMIPAFTCAEIPREDAWRLLANRLIEQLESVDELLEWRSTLSPLAHYRTVKLYLDMATSLLVFAGGYAPTYKERARNLGKLVHSPAGAGVWPFSLEPFIDDVVRCTEWKLCPPGIVLNADRRFWERVIDYAQALWGWELALLQQSDSSAEPADLMTLWMRRQPLRDRLRGWAHVLSKHGWFQSSPAWPRYLRLIARASPRHLVYAAGSTVLFELGAARKSRPVPDLERLRRDLPVQTWSNYDGDLSSLHSLAKSIVLNYKHFVAETRA